MQSAIDQAEPCPVAKPKGNGHDHDAQSALDDEAEIVRLAALSMLEYELDRSAAAERLGVRAPILDKLVKAARPADTASPGQGRLVELCEPEQWREPVDGAILISDLEAAILAYICMTKEQAHAVALWVLFTHCFAIAWCAPELVIKSAQKRSGKTRLIEVLTYLVNYPLATSNITVAALFRVIESRCPTLLLDEAETFVRDNEELRGIINSGFNRSAAYVLRTVGDDHEVRQFSTWCPQVLAGIGNLPDTIGDCSSSSL